MFSSINKLWTIIDFKINQAYIVKELCENRDKPMMNCNGKCYLAKQMKAEEKREKEKLPPLEKEKVEIIYIIDSISTTVSNITTFNLEKKLYFYAHEFSSLRYSDDIFRPPILT